MNFDIYITNKNTGDTFHYEKALPYADAVRFISYSDAFAFSYQPRR